MIPMVDRQFLSHASFKEIVGQITCLSLYVLGAKSIFT